RHRVADVAGMRPGISFRVPGRVLRLADQRGERRVVAYPARRGEGAQPRARLIAARPLLPLDPDALDGERRVLARDAAAEQGGALLDPPAEASGEADAAQHP